MFFTKTARILSSILLVLGILRFLMGILVATSMTQEREVVARYLGTTTSGEAIDKGLLYIFIAIVLGVLVEISTVIHKKNQENI